MSDCELIIDVASFISLIRACEVHRPANRPLCPPCADRLQQAVELYRGDFRTHSYLDDCPAYEEWVVFKREWLHRQALYALHQLARYYERQGQFEVAHRYAWRQVELDPLCEDGHQQLMRALALSGRRSEALAHDAGVGVVRTTQSAHEGLRPLDYGMPWGWPRRMAGPQDKLPSSKRQHLPAHRCVPSPAYWLGSVTGTIRCSCAVPWNMIHGPPE